MCLSVVKYAQDAGRRPTKSLDLLPVGVQQRDEAAGARDRLLRSFLHAGQEELEPRFPVSRRANAREQVVIDLTIGLELETQVKDRLRQRAARTK